MSLKQQLKKITDNWLLLVIVLVVLVVINAGTSIVSPLSATKSYAASADLAYGRGIYNSESFAPDVTERQITVTTTMSTEVDRGDFERTAQQLQGIISNSGSILLNENVDTRTNKGSNYKVGSYTIKVPVDIYDSTVSDLKSIGEVTTFSENKDDITGSYENLQIELAAEKARLQRFKDLYEESKTEDKVSLIDRIFDQERRIKYLEDSLQNQDNRIDYATVYLTIQEKQPYLWGISVVGMQELLRTIVNSFNSLLYLLFAVIPWAVVIAIIWIVVRLVRK